MRIPAALEAAHLIDRYGEARTLYHVTPDLSSLPDPGSLPAAACPALLDDPDARRVLHIAYGEILASADLRAGLARTLEENLDAYWAGLERHLARHLEALAVPVTAAGEPA